MLFSLFSLHTLACMQRNRISRVLFPLVSLHC